MVKWKILSVIYHFCTLECKFYEENNKNKNRLTSKELSEQNWII